MFLKNKGFLFSMIFALSSINSFRVMGTSEALVPLKHDVSTTTQGNTTKTTTSQSFVGRNVTLNLDKDDRLTDGDVLFFAEYIACFLAEDYKASNSQALPMGVTTAVDKMAQGYVITIKIPLDEANLQDFDRYIDRISKNPDEYRNKLAECIKNWKIDKEKLFGSIDNSLSVQKTCMDDGLCLTSNLVNDVLDLNSVIEDLFLRFDPIFFMSPFFALGDGSFSGVDDAFDKNQAITDGGSLIKSTGEKGLELKKGMLDLYRHNTPKVLKEVLQKCLTKMHNRIDVNSYKTVSKSVEVKFDRN